jgi:hypothetical protein
VKEDGRGKKKEVKDEPQRLMSPATLH